VRGLVGWPSEAELASALRNERIANLLESTGYISTHREELLALVIERIDSNILSRHRGKTCLVSLMLGPTHINSYTLPFYQLTYVLHIFDCFLVVIISNHQLYTRRSYRCNNRSQTSNI
jgi:hypothetical protein